ncbi:MAG: hypothetical protein JO017_01070, partial [Actinobacteria bacterium]|nr:hypothetical protein [Actinomycetota bacterium]
MFSSLRVRLPLIFLGGILVAALVTTAIAIQLFGSLAHDQTETDLRREADGIAQLYSSAINQDFNTSFKNQSRRAPTFAGKSLERATNTRIYW